jgi:hypothetical protein
MGPPTRRGGVAELQLSICPRTSCLASPMTIVMYQQFRSWIAGITTYRTEDTTGHNLVHALSIRAVHLPPSCPTRFPDCVGLVPNSTATTLRTVKASDTGLSSRSMGHSGSGTKSSRMQFPCHYTSYLEFWHQHISVSSPVTYSHRSPLGFYFISRLEDDQLKLPCASCNRRFNFVRIFVSRHTFFYSARLIRNSLSGSRPCSFEDISILSPCGSVFSYPSSTASISHVIFIPLLHARPRLRPLWSAAACHTLTSLALLSHQLDGFVAASSYTAVSGSAAIVYGLPHYQCLCRVSSMCFRVRLAFAFLTPTACMHLFSLDSYCVSAIRFSHVTSYLLLDCSLLRLLISPVHFFPSFQKT